MRETELIELNKMTFYAYHGVMEQERIVGHTFTVDLKLFLDLAKACQSDCLEDTVNYAAVYESVKTRMQTPSNLLEHVANEIILQIKDQFPIVQKVEIRIAKINPPVGGEMYSAAVVLKK